MNDNRHNGQFLLGFFLGGLIGALVIFFLGTKEGKRLEKKLESRGKDILDELDDKLAEFEKNGRDLVKKGEEIKNDVMEAWEDRKDEMTDAARDRIDSALAQIEELQSKGVEQTTAIRRKFKNLPARRRAA